MSLKSQSAFVALEPAQTNILVLKSHHLDVGCFNLIYLKFLCSALDFNH